MTKNLENYLNQVATYLVGDREDIIMEIRGHILEKAAGPEGEATPEAIDRVIEELGDPQSLASNYSEGKDIILPHFRNLLFLYTGILFAIHLGATAVAAVTGGGVAVFPLIFVPELGSIWETLFFLPFAFIFDFGLVSLVLFAVSQSKGGLKLPIPTVDSDQDRPSPWVLLYMGLGLAAVAAAWQYAGDWYQAGNVTIIMPTQGFLTIALVLLGVAVWFYFLKVLSRSTFMRRLLAVLGSVASLAALIITNAHLAPGTRLVEGVNPEHARLNEMGFQALLVLIAVLITIDLVKHVIRLFAVMGTRRARVEFAPADSSDWSATILRLALYMGLMVGAGVFIHHVPWLFALVALGGLAWLVSWHSKRFGFRCGKCSQEFEISFLADLISPHGFTKEPGGGLVGWHLLRCPHCRKWSRATVVKKLTKPEI